MAERLWRVRIVKRTKATDVRWAAVPQRAKQISQTVCAAGHLPKLQAGQYPESARPPEALGCGRTREQLLIQFKIGGSAHTRG